MTSSERQQFWPTKLAVLQNGDSTPPYYRPREPHEGLGDFMNRIASTVVSGSVEYPYVEFVEVMDGSSAETDEALTIIVQEYIEKERGISS